MNVTGDPNQGAIPSRKREHVEIVVGRDVAFRRKTTGLERYELLHNALPELDLEEIDTSVPFLGRTCSLPLLVSSMTGGYDEAEHINRELAEVCAEVGIGMGLGSQRQALASRQFVESFRVARRVAPDIPLFGNLGAAEIAGMRDIAPVEELVEMVGADGFAIHLNPLQELLQPEGSPRFRDVLDGIERIVTRLDVPVIVKEVGAGLSQRVVERLLDVGVRIVDVAGGGGTSWSGVELLRGDDRYDESTFWDWGIPTAEAVIGARPLCDSASALLIASGGIASARDAAVAIALGAGMVGVARPFLRLLLAEGTGPLIALVRRWERELRGMMFLTGSRTIGDLRQAPLRSDPHP